jgi:hypothetical protein
MRGRQQEAVRKRGEGVLRERKRSSFRMAMAFTKRREAQMRSLRSDEDERERSEGGGDVRAQ